jgi:hypothetical protein
MTEGDKTGESRELSDLGQHYVTLTETQDAARIGAAGDTRSLDRARRPAVRMK